MLHQYFPIVTFLIDSLPDKAIDLIDESAAKLAMELQSMPSEMDELKRRIDQLEIERQVVRKESDQVFKKTIKGN